MTAPNKHSDWNALISTGNLERLQRRIAADIVDRERTDSRDLLANSTPTFSWVRLAQRIPVRIALENVHSDHLLIAGRTATIEIKPTSANSRPQTASATLDHIGS